MKILGSGHSVITILLLLTPVRGLVTKMRLCVEYKKENHLAKGEYITTSHANTEHKCMIKCMRHYPCMAFNNHAVNKTCILMPELWCMSPSSLNDTRYLLVQLNPCKQQPVFISIRPEERGWSWVTTDDPSNNADILKLPGFNNRDISRTLYHGYYLPGFWRGDGEGFRAVDPVTMSRSHEVCKRRILGSLRFFFSVGLVYCWRRGTGLCPACDSTPKWNADVYCEVSICLWEWKQGTNFRILYSRHKNYIFC